jgi:hypothetical protein
VIETKAAAIEGLTDAHLRIVIEDIPEIELIGDADMRRKVTLVFASFLKESTYRRISEAPAFPGLTKYDLARHTRQVVQHCVVMADTMRDLWGIDCDRDILLAAAVLHDSSKLVEYEGGEGKKSEVGKTFLHAQLAGVRCRDVGLPNEVAYIVTMHPFTPPHVHVTPRNVEFVILTYADLGSADPVFFKEGLPTHLDIKKRFFSLD